MNFSNRYLTKEEQERLVKAGGWNDKCPIQLDRLSFVHVTYKDFNNRTKEGEIIVFDVVADSVVKIFMGLYEFEFPIHSVKLIEEYGFDDYKSMTANNTHAFNNRFVFNSTDTLSSHAYGTAIDINPELNPMIELLDSNDKYTEARVYPAAGKKFVNRMLIQPGMVEPIVEILLKNGFDEWGGLWRDLPDLHHFQVNRKFSEELASASKNESFKLWQKHLQTLANSI